MGLRTTLRRGLVRTAGALGYQLLRDEDVPYGTRPLLDVERIADAFGWELATVLDVGAHFGEFAREVHSRLPDATVHSFEPHPPTYQRLVAENPGGWLRPAKVALGKEVGTATMHVYGEVSTINSLVPDARYPTRHGLAASVEEVPVTTVDRYCEENGIARVDLLKVDAEGFDLAVVQGAGRMLGEAAIRLVLTEFNDLLPRPGATGGALLPIAELLAGHGYDCVATYTDYVLLEDPIFHVANALFVSTRSPRAARPPR